MLLPLLLKPGARRWSAASYIKGNAANSCFAGPHPFPTPPSLT